LSEGGTAVRFAVRVGERIQAAFVVRHQGIVRGFYNRCAHRWVELDWEPGQFFDADRRYLVCASHGALYDPADGLCVAGPCRGGRIAALSVREHDGVVWLAEPVGPMINK
jgi:nitrite reductase/ring-hydroxylating ferredoxin subunit